MKRSLSLVLVPLFLLTMWILPLHATAAAAPTLSMEALSAEAGQSVQMRLFLLGNPGIVAMRVTVHFDTKVLRLESAENGDVFPLSTATFGKELTGETYTILWLDALKTENYTADGTLATLTFRVLPGAKAGVSTVSLTYDSNSVFDCNLNPAPDFTTQNGSVTVRLPSVPVTGVSLQPMLSLKVGEKSRLSVMVLPINATNPAVIWRSENTAVASVDEQGNVTAHAVGTAHVIVTTADGGKTASCTVTVLPSTIGVTGVSLQPGDLTMNYRDSARLTATVEPGNATNPAVVWSSSDSKVVEVDEYGNLTTHRKGTATVMVTTVDGGKTASCRVTVQYTFVQKIIIYLLFGWIWYVK